MADAQVDPRKRHAVGVMQMNGERIAGSPDGHHVRPWLCPGRPGVDHRHVPAAHQSRQRVATTPLVPAGHKPKLFDQVREAIRMRHYRVWTEVKALLSAQEGVHWIMASLL